MKKMMVLFFLPLMVFSACKDDELETNDNDELETNDNDEIVMGDLSGMEVLNYGINLKTSLNDNVEYNFWVGAKEGDPQFKFYQNSWTGAGSSFIESEISVNDETFGLGVIMKEETRYEIEHSEYIIEPDGTIEQNDHEGTACYSVFPTDSMYQVTIRVPQILNEGGIFSENDMVETGEVELRSSNSKIIWNYEHSGYPDSTGNWITYWDSGCEPIVPLEQYQYYPFKQVDSNGNVKLGWIKFGLIQREIHLLETAIQRR